MSPKLFYRFKKKFLLKFITLITFKGDEKKFNKHAYLSLNRLLHLDSLFDFHGTDDIWFLSKLQRVSQACPKQS